MKLTSILLLMKMKEGNTRRLIRAARNPQEKVILENQLDVLTAHRTYLSERMERWKSSPNPPKTVKELLERDEEFIRLLDEMNRQAKSWKADPQSQKEKIINYLVKRSVSEEMREEGQRLLLHSDRATLTSAINSIIAENNSEIARKATLHVEIKNVMKTFSKNRYRIAPSGPPAPPPEPVQPSLWRRIGRYLWPF